MNVDTINSDLCHLIPFVYFIKAQQVWTLQRFLLYPNWTRQLCSCVCVSVRYVYLRIISAEFM